MVLTEWLAEVSWGWQLTSSILFRAVSYLDQYISQHTIEVVSRFQSVGLACLRAAIRDNTKSLSLQLPDEDAHQFADINGGLCTSDAVEVMTSTVVQTIPEHVKHAPNAAVFLIRLWHCATLSTLLSVDEMHIYSVAGFSWS